MNIEIIIQLIGFIFGTLLGIFIKYIFDKRRHTTNKLFEMKIEKYGFIVKNMVSLIENDAGNIIEFKSSKNKYSKNDYIKILTREYFECFTYGSNKILDAYNNFLENPKDENFLRFVIKVREDLWGKFKLRSLKGISIGNKALFSIYNSNNTK